MFIVHVFTATSFFHQMFNRERPKLGIECTKQYPCTCKYTLEISLLSIYASNIFSPNWPTYNVIMICYKPVALIHLAANECGWITDPPTLNRGKFTKVINSHYCDD